MAVSDAALIALMEYQTRRDADPHPMDASDIRLAHAISRAVARRVDEWLAEQERAALPWWKRIFA